MSFLLAYHRRRTWGPPANCRIQTKQKLVLFWLTLRDRILCAVVVRGCVLRAATDDEVCREVAENQKLIHRWQVQDDGTWVSEQRLQPMLLVASLVKMLLIRFAARNNKNKLISVGHI
jgi:hypothetical protein